MPPPLLSAFGDLGDFGDGFFDDEEEVDEPDEPDEPDELDEGVFERCLGGAVIASTLLDAIALAAAAAAAVRLAGSSCKKNLGPLCPVTLLRR